MHYDRETSSVVINKCRCEGIIKIIYWFILCNTTTHTYTTNILKQQQQQIKTGNIPDARQTRLKPDQPNQREGGSEGGIEGGTEGGRESGGTEGG